MFVPTLIVLVLCGGCNEVISQAARQSIASFLTTVTNTAINASAGLN
jgi:hypothetical protein